MSWWTNGFWSGILCLIYRYSKNDRYARWAASCGEKLEQVILGLDRMDHDVGFLFHLSAVAEYKLTENNAVRKKGLLAASLLASRFI